MPTYTYKNLETGELYEFKQSMKDEAYTQHPETGAPVKRLVSAPAITFRGSGFYVNDSRSNGSRSSGGDSAGSTGSGSGEKG